MSPSSCAGVPAVRPRLGGEDLVLVDRDDGREQDAVELGRLGLQALHRGAEGLLLVDQVALLLEFAILLLDEGVRVGQLEVAVAEHRQCGGQGDAQQDDRDEALARLAWVASRRGRR